MPTSLDLYNRAMAAMGARSTIALTTETSAEALALTQHYDPLRQELLESYPWNFNRRAALLVVHKSHPTAFGSAATGTTWNSTWPPPPWIYAYLVPTGFLRARYVTPRTSDTVTNYPVQTNDYYSIMNPPHRFVMGSDVDGSANPIDVILTDVASAVCIFSADVTDPNGWSAMFTQTFVWYLAARVAMQLSMDMEVVKLNLAQAEAAMQRVKVMDANQGMSPLVVMPDWIKARGFALNNPDAGYLP